MSILIKLSKTKPRVLLHKILFLTKMECQKLFDKLTNSYKTYKYQIIISTNYKTIVITGLNAFELEEVDCIVDKRFFWLGMDGEPIQSDSWKEDFISGYIWNDRYFQDIVTVNQENNADVKIPWELSRLQHLSRLAIIYRHSQNATILNYIRKEIDKWIDRNPFKYTVNWTCAMEVGIRAVNLIFIALLIPEQLFEDKLFFRKFLSTLMNHGYFIKQNLETYDEYYNNHYLSDLLGLQWIGLFCENYLQGRDRKTAQRWYQFARKGLKAESEKQIFPDGTDYESSIAYHRFVTELFYMSVFIDKIYEKQPHEELIRTVKKMTAFLSEIRMPDGSLPMIGDSDDGRILFLDKYSHWDRQRADFIFEHANQLLNGRLDLPNEPIPPVSAGNAAFKDSGYYILRNEKIYCMTHCGPLSLHGHGGHSHNDQLAVVLCFNNLPFITDSGTGSYSGYPELRNYFRSTSAHSTLEVIGMEQNELVKENLYMMREKTFSKCLDYCDGFFSGEHFGYKNSGITHRRNIHLNDSGLVVEDSVIGGQIETDRQWRLHFILDTDVIVKQIDKDTIAMKKRGVTILLRSSVPVSYSPTIVSKEYGKTENSVKISTIPTRMRNIKTEFVYGGF